VENTGRTGGAYRYSPSFLSFNLVDDQFPLLGDLFVEPSLINDGVSVSPLPRGPPLGSALFDGH
jgi:hypothetical protein